MKKLFSILLALVLVMGLCGSAFASGQTNTPATYTITMSTTANHSYTAYQVFSGKLTESNGKTVLSDIEWGSGVNGDALMTALRADSTYGSAFTSCASASDVADVLSAYDDDSAAIKAIAKIIAANKATAAGSGTTSITGLAAGYYLILDTTAAADMPDGQTYSDFMLEVVKDVTVEAKDGSTTSQKKVKDADDTAGTVTDWQDSADYDIGDAVPFQLKATVASDYANYDTYKLVFHDKESAGLSFNISSVKVYVDGTEITTGFEVKTSGLADSNCTFEVVFADLKTVTSVKAGSVITVEYTSTLNTSAVIGSTGNPNEMHVEYSNNPNSDQTGTTPDDKVIVFTYETIINKVDKDKNALTGADFTLYKEVPSTVSGAQTGADIKAGFNSDVKATALDDAKYYVVVGNKTGDATGSTFDFKGIDDGNYVLVETTIPNGYNAWDAVAFTVSATHDVNADNPQLTALTGGDLFTGSVSAGTLTATIENKSGRELPSTGGIGTTLFYVIGGLMVAGATVVLVSRKRME